ncbi:MAG: DUF423 domain-containing protein [Rhodospirillales bacterium]|nr:DUF423 domain-containing protein [Rhodospirillales bacterium]
MQRLWIGVGGVSGLLSVGLAALAAHALAPSARNLVQEGLAMQFPHALALLAVGLWAPRGGRLADAAGAAFALGTVLFCGELYVHAATGVSLGVVAPTGGTVLMIGWLLLAVSALRAR